MSVNFRKVEMNSNSNQMQVAAVRTCSTCQHWDKREQGSYGFNQGLGQCLNVPKYHEATENDAGKDEPECFKDGPDRGAVKASFRQFKAFALDASGHMAELLVAAEFGCIAHVPAND